MKLLPEQKDLFEKLSLLQKKIVIGMLNGLSSTEAYRQAGGKAKTKESVYASASEILRNPKVTAFMDSVMESLISDAIMEREEALKRLTSIARSNFTDVCDLTENGFVLKDHLSREQINCIQEVINTKQGVKVKMRSSLGAIKELSRLQGWETPRRYPVKEVDGKKPQMNDYELAKRCLFLLNQDLAYRGLIGSDTSDPSRDSGAEIARS